MSSTRGGPESPRIYLDHAATTPLRAEVLELLEREHRDGFANPSSSHREGREAREALEAARDRLARALGAPRARVVFTSGGTESDHLALRGAAAALEREGRPRRALTTPIEHPAVHGALDFLEKAGWEVTHVPVGPDGQLELEALSGQLEREGVSLASVISCNNEVGVAQPVGEIAARLHEHGALLHVDAVQHLGKLPLDLGGEEAGIDLLTITAHKICGPKGIGALVLGESLAIDPLVVGGGQEAGLRAGTPWVVGAQAFALAVELAVGELEATRGTLEELRDRLLEGLESRLEGITLHSPRRGGAPHILNVSFDGVRGSALQAHLDREGVAVSTGSACHSGTDEPSGVLTALGRDPEVARGSVRFSLGHGLDSAAIDRAVEITVRGVSRLREIAGV